MKFNQYSSDNLRDRPFPFPSYLLSSLLGLAIANLDYLNPNCSTILSTPPIAIAAPEIINQPSDTINQPSEIINQPIETLDQPAETDDNQPKKEEFFKPFELDLNDPLLPRTLERGEDFRKVLEENPLTRQEQQNLASALAQLAETGEKEFSNGKKDDAFKIWYRELRLARFLGPVIEVQSLGRVGEIAWQESRGRDLQAINERLKTIQKEAEGNEAEKKPLSPELFTALGEAYLKTRLYRQAVAMYDLILAQARANGNIQEVEANLIILGGLHLDWFNYAEAEKAYQELLALSRAQFDSANIIAYLEKLIYIYQQSGQREPGIIAKKELLDRYLTKKNFARLAAVKISLADDYVAIGQGELASQNYQEAFDIAWLINQYAYAGDALQKLAKLYYSFGQLKEAVDIYQEQLKVTQQASDFYGMMATYDRLGQIYLELNEYEYALIAFEEGLKLARELGHQEEYFLDQVNQVEEERYSEEPASP